MLAQLAAAAICALAPLAAAQQLQFTEPGSGNIIVSGEPTNAQLAWHS